MTTPQARKQAFCFLPVTVATVIALSACTKEEQPDPKVVDSSQYVLKDTRYFFAAGDYVDTTSVNLRVLQVQNQSDAIATQQIEGGFGELVKTSQFELDQTTTLPKGVELSEFNLKVPQHWYGNGSFDYSVEAFPLSTTPQQKPYGFNPEHILTIRVPPKSIISVIRQIEAYQLACSFQGVLENTTTGQRYPVRGKWKGLLQYAHPSVELKQSPL